MTQEDDKALETLEREFLAVSPPLNEEPPEQLSKKIHDLAHQRITERLAVRPHETSNIAIGDFGQRRKIPLQIGVSLAAGIFLGVLVTNTAQYLSDGPASDTRTVWQGSKDSAQRDNAQLLYPQVEESLGTLAAEPPEQWLAYIKKLIDQGRLQEAEYAIGRFKEQFPDWESSSRGQP